MIIDAQRTNRFFRRPPKTALGSAESLSRLSVDGGSYFFIAQEDVKDFFYRLRIPRDLGEYFALPDLDPGRLGEVFGNDLISEIQELCLNYGNAPIHSIISVLPMGLSCSLGTRSTESGCRKIRTECRLYR